VALTIGTRGALRLGNYILERRIAEIFGIFMGITPFSGFIRCCASARHPCCVRRPAASSTTYIDRVLAHAHCWAAGGTGAQGTEWTENAGGETFRAREERRFRAQGQDREGQAREGQARCNQEKSGVAVNEAARNRGEAPAGREQQTHSQVQAGRLAARQARCGGSHEGEQLGASLLPSQRE
jgi:hypothetical protein